MIKEKIFGVVNLIYGLLTCLYILAINGVSRVFSGQHTDSFFFVVSIVLLVMSIAVLVCNICAKKSDDKVIHNCSLAGMGVAVCNIIASLITGGVTILSIVSLVIGVIMITRKS